MSLTGTSIPLYISRTVFLSLFPSPSWIKKYALVYVEGILLYIQTFKHSFTERMFIFDLLEDVARVVSFPRLAS